MPGDKRTARDLGTFFCFEDEAGQGLRPPKGRTRARRGARPVVRMRGAGGGRVSIAGVACYRPGDRPHLFYKLRAYYRPHLIGGCLATTGLKSNPGDHTVLSG